MLEDESAIIIQARMGSNRFPGKMLFLLAGVPLVEYVYRRCRLSRVKKIVVAVSDDTSDDVLYDFCRKKDIPASRGSLHNVLERYIRTGELLKVSYIVRVCGDTPLADIHFFEEALNLLVSKKLDYVSPDKAKCAPGFYSEAVTLDALRKVRSLSRDKGDLEHVTSYIANHTDSFLTMFLSKGVDMQPAGKPSFTVDYPEDLIFVNEIISRLKDKFCFTSSEVLDILRRRKHL